MKTLNRKSSLAVIRDINKSSDFVSLLKYITIFHFLEVNLVSVPSCLVEVKEILLNCFLNLVRCFEDKCVCNHPLDQPNVLSTALHLLYLALLPSFDVK